ncbi:MAG: hypothetical protein JO267_16195 [Alphaproteobacteria bacterium]|nr:hypothetical protein [Alphaproteobacteria bacterium]
MRATPFLARYTSASGTRKVPIQFFAASRKEAVRLAKAKAGKGLLLGLALTAVEPLGSDREPDRKAA